MSPSKLIISVIVITLIFGYFFYPKPDIKPVDPTELPWNITINDSNQASIFGLTMSKSTLQQATDVFGEADSMALYADKNKPSIEVYFGYVKKAGLTAKVIVSLSLSLQQADDFLKNAKSRMQSNSDIPKIELDKTDHVKTLDLAVTSITYLPKYSGLDKDYLIDRFGKPKFQLTLSETAEQLFYPQLGLSVIYDSEGKEVFQYTNPKQLVIPETAIAYER